MVIQLIQRRTGQRVLRADDHARERLWCAERKNRVVHHIHPRSLVFLYLRLRRAYRGLLFSDAFSSQVSARPQGFFSGNLKKKFEVDCRGNFLWIHELYPTNP